MIYTGLGKETIDMSLYGADAAPSQTKYGLPSRVQFCCKCVISNQRPNSAVEYKHTTESKKAVITFGEDRRARHIFGLTLTATGTCAAPSSKKPETLT